MPPSHVRAFASDAPEYRRAFQTFLDHTDQKEKASAWLARLLADTRGRGLFVDAGAGTGKLTAMLGGGFARTVAVEPNPSLVPDLRAACPAATVHPVGILDAPVPPGEADFVLCSHVFYYVPPADWAATVCRLASWLAVGGVLAITIQNPGTGGMGLVRHFLGGRFDLGELVRDAEAAPGGRFNARVDTVPANIRCTDLTTACEIAEFILNVLPIPHPPAWADLERYVDAHFRHPDGGYGWACDQDFLHVERVG